MNGQRVLVAAMVLGFVTFAPSLATATCWGYFDVQAHCVGTGGCSEPYFYSLCTSGCIHGQCIDHGSSGQCCGHIYYSAVIYQDGGNCSGSECGLLRAHPSHSAKNRKQRNPERGTGTSLERVGFGGNSPFLGYAAPRLLFVPDRCAHTYQIIVQRGLSVDLGGM
jgi:hypothetical protein